MMNRIERTISVIFAIQVLCSCQASDLWHETLKQAEQEQSKGLNKEALNSYLLAVKQMQSHDALQKEQIATLNKCVLLLLQEKKVELADKYAQQALALAERSFGPDNIDCMPQWVLQRKVCQAIPDRNRAAACLDHMIEIQEKRTGDSPPLMWLLDEYARGKSQSCGDSFDPDKLRKLVQLREKFDGAETLDTLRARLILASALSELGARKEALSIFASSLKLAQAKYPGVIPELALNYSRALKKNKEGDKALPVLKEAYALAGPGKSFNPVLGPELAAELGSLLQEQKRTKEAASIYREMTSTLIQNKNPLRAEFFQLKLKECS
ncbi:MAG: hypothetical protein K2X27_09375 [Candidatus Obscuribacterales bacterium]|nr:hypothetical protein [Candidatus Obscuribacterales bacterium]